MLRAWAQISIAAALSGCLGVSDGDEINREGGTPSADRAPAASQAAAGLTLDEPTEGQIVLRSRVRFSGTAPHVERVKLGEQPVEVGEDGRWAANVELPDGTHEVTVSATGASPVTVRFVVDSHAPEIIVESPNRGLFHRPDADFAEIVFRGAVWDSATGVAQLTIGGQPVELDAKGGFEHMHIPAEGLSTVLVEATDGAGRTARTLRSMLSGRFAPVDEPVADALEIAVDGPTLAAIADGIEAVVQEQAVNALVRQGGGGDFEVRNVSYTRLEIDLVPDHGGFRVTVRVFGLRIDVKIKQKILFATVTLTGHADANPAEMTGFISMSVTADGRLAMSLQDPGVALHGFSFDINDFPGFLEGWLEGMVRGFAEDAIRGALQNLVFPELFDPADLVQQIEINDRVVTLDLRLQLLTISPDGMLLRARTHATTDAVGVLPPHPGRYLTTAPGRLDADPGAVRISMVDDAINQLLHAIWMAGGLDVHGDIPASDDLALALDVKGLGDLLGADLSEAAPADAPLEIALKPLLPPVWAAADPGGEKLATLDLADCFLSFLAVVPEGPPIPLVAVTFAAYFDVGIPPEPGAPAPIVGAAIHADLFGEAVDFEDERVEEVIERLLTLVAPLLGGVLDDAAADGVQPDGLPAGESRVQSDGAGIVIDVLAAD